MSHVNAANSSERPRPRETGSEYTYQPVDTSGYTSPSQDRDKGEDETLSLDLDSEKLRQAVQESST